MCKSAWDCWKKDRSLPVKTKTLTWSETCVDVSTCLSDIQCTTALTFIRIYNMWSCAKWDTIFVILYFVISNDVASHKERLSLNTFLKFNRVCVLTLYITNLSAEILNYSINSKFIWKSLLMNLICIY